MGNEKTIELIKQGTYNPGKIGDKELLADHKTLHAWWNTMLKTGKARVGGRNNEDLWNLHRLVVEEMERRGFSHTFVTEVLDSKSFPGLKKKNNNLEDVKNSVAGLKSAVLIPEFISLVGSCAEGSEFFSDIDIVIKLSERNERIENLVFKKEDLQELYNKCHIVYDKAGSHGDHIPLYDLVLVKRKNLEKEKVDYRFPLFEAAPQNCELEDSYLGMKAFLHKSGSEVKLMTSDGEEIKGADDLNQETAVVEKPKTFIIKGYYDTEGSFYAEDILRWNTTELLDSSFKDRNFFLDKLTYGLCLKRLLPDMLEFSQSSIVVGKSFVPLKSTAGFGRFSFNNVDNLLKHWAVSELLSKGIAVEQKFDGFRIVIHKQGSLVKMFTEDKKRDRAPNLPELRAEILKLSGDFIIDSEVVMYDDAGKAIARHLAASIVSSKGEVKGNVKANIFDCLYHKTKSSEAYLYDKAWAERQRHLKIILANDTKHLHRVIPVVANSAKELKLAIDKAASLEGSEGAMLKAIWSAYKLTGRSAEWAKYKTVKELHVKVIGIREKTGGGFLYRAAFLKKKNGSDLIPMEAQKRMAPKDLTQESEWKMGAGFKNRKSGEYAYGETFATGVKAKIGDLITVDPVSVLQFKSREGEIKYAWMFPRVRNLETALSRPDDLDDIKRVTGVSSEGTKSFVDEVLAEISLGDFPVFVDNVSA